MNSDTVHTYFQYVSELLKSINVAALLAVVERLKLARSNGDSVYVIGNGGSAATASHFAADLGKGAKRTGRPPLRVISLTDNSAWSFALGNDEGFDNVFSGQLDNHARDGDVLIAISASGNSPNLIKAVELAKHLGVTTIGITGFSGGALVSMVDIAVHVPSKTGFYGPIEDIHMSIAHAITDCLKQD